MYLFINVTVFDKTEILKKEKKSLLFISEFLIFTVKFSFVNKKKWYPL